MSRSYAGVTGTVSSETVSHPSLGTPPRNLFVFPDAAARLTAERSAIAARALEVAVAADPTIGERHDQAGLRNLLRDAEVLTDRLALCVAGDDPFWLREFADQSAPVFRRRKVPVDDVVQLCEGLRTGARGIVGEAEMGSVDRAIDAAVEIFGWYRRLAGDARRRNPIAAALYKGV
jgi:hypothetical protein